MPGNYQSFRWFLYIWTFLSLVSMLTHYTTNWPCLRQAILDSNSHPWKCIDDFLHCGCVRESKHHCSYNVHIQNTLKNVNHEILHNDKLLKDTTWNWYISIKKTITWYRTSYFVLLVKLKMFNKSSFNSLPPPPPPPPLYPLHFIPGIDSEV